MSFKAKLSSKGLLLEENASKFGNDNFFSNFSKLFSFLDFEKRELGKAIELVWFEIAGCCNDDDDDDEVVEVNPNLNKLGVSVLSLLFSFKFSILFVDTNGLLIWNDDDDDESLSIFLLVVVVVPNIKLFWIGLLTSFISLFSVVVVEIEPNLNCSVGLLFVSIFVIVAVFCSFNFNDSSCILDNKLLLLLIESNGIVFDFLIDSLFVISFVPNEKLLENLIGCWFTVSVDVFKPKLILDEVVVLLLLLFKYENEPAAATKLENLVFWSSLFFDLFSLDCFGFVQQIQFVLSESFVTKHSEHVHLALLLLLLFIVVFGFNVEQQAQLVLDSSFCIKHV